MTFDISSLQSLLSTVVSAFSSEVGKDALIVVIAFYLSLRFYDAYVGPVTNKYLSGIMSIITGLLKYAFDRIMAVGAFLKDFPANKPTDPPK